MCAPATSTECPNVGKFLSNLVFSLEMENEIMGAILNDGADPKAAATAWLKANPDAVTPWLEGVTTFDGGDAAAAVKAALGRKRLPSPCGKGRRVRAGVAAVTVEHDRLHPHPAAVRPLSPEGGG